MSRPLLELTDVHKAFGGVAANRGVSLKVADQGVTGLIGPNGSGKTTLFNSIAGTHPIDRGSIRLEGREISHLSVQRIARLGLARTFQQTRVFSRMNLVQNLLIALPHRRSRWGDMFRAFPRKLTDKAEELLAFVGLQAKRRHAAGSLSFGQQKLLELAMALMNEPRVLLLDEPTAGINPTLVNELMDRLRSANRQLGVTLFVIEHNMRVIMNLADRIYCLSRGAVLAEGPPERIRRDPLVIDAYLGAQ